MADAMAGAPRTRKDRRRFSGSIEPGPLGPGPAPLDRTPELPIPQIAPAAKRTRAAPERPARTRWPRRTPKKDDAAGREEYPGPRSSASGDRVEPGEPAPAK